MMNMLVVTKMSDPLLSIIPGEDNEIQRNLNRLPDIDQNILNVRREFIGKPEVCHTLVGHIIHLRRDPNSEYHKEEFYKLLDAYKDVLLEHYDVRWLLSIVDTIVDVGNVTSSAIAMNIVQCINGTNLHNSILVNVVNGTLDSNKLKHEMKVPTWGGMITADIPSGDMIHNMMIRLDTVIEKDELLNHIWCRIKDIGRDSENILMNHFCKASRFEHQRKYFK